MIAYIVNIYIMDEDTSEIVYQEICNNQEFAETRARQVLAHIFNENIKHGEKGCCDLDDEYLTDGLFDYKKMKNLNIEHILYENFGFGWRTRIVDEITKIKIPIDIELECSLDKPIHIENLPIINDGDDGCDLN